MPLTGFELSYNIYDGLILVLDRLILTQCVTFFSIFKKNVLELEAPWKMHGPILVRPHWPAENRILKHTLLHTWRSMNNENRHDAETFKFQCRKAIVGTIICLKYDSWKLLTKYIFSSISNVFNLRCMKRNATLQYAVGIRKLEFGRVPYRSKKSFTSGL